MTKGKKTILEIFPWKHFLKINLVLLRKYDFSFTSYLRFISTSCFSFNRSHPFCKCLWHFQYKSKGFVSTDVSRYSWRLIYLRMGSWFRVNAICDIVQEKLIFWSRIDSLILWFQLDTRYQSKCFLILIMTVYEIHIGGNPNVKTKASFKRK